MDTNYQDISLSFRDGNARDDIAIVALQRPEKLNAYTLSMGDELVAVLNDLKVRASVSAVVLTGTGKGFCAGADFSYLKTVGQENCEGVVTGREHFIDGFCCDLFHYPKLLIAAVNGIAVGLGVTMILPCDFRLAAESASFAMPFLKNSIMPGFGSSFLLPRLVGESQAKALVYSGRSFSPSYAKSIGLVSDVYPDNSFLDDVVDFAKTMLAHPPGLLEAAKQRLHFGSSANSIEQAFEFERSQSLQ